MIGNMRTTDTYDNIRSVIQYMLYILYRLGWPATDDLDNKSEALLRPRLQLYSRTKYNVQILSDGSVRGTRDHFSSSGN
jgi:hypothetical protein